MGNEVKRIISCEVYEELISIIGTQNIAIEKLIQNNLEKENLINVLMEEDITK